MKSITSSCDTEGAWRPAWTLLCNHRYISIESQMPLLPGVREMTPSGRWELDLEVPSNADFYPTSRNPPIVQVKLLSGCLNCLLDSGELEFPVDLTFSHLPSPFPLSLSASTNRSPSSFVYKTTFTTNSEGREGSIEDGGALCRILEAPWVLPLTLAP